MEEKLQQSNAAARHELHESEARLELFFSQSLDGFFFMMLDEPVRWDDTVDKDSVLDYVFAHQRVTKVNDAMLAQYGATREQFLGLTPNDFYQHNLAHGREIWRRFFDAGRLHVETDERKLDGTPISIEGDYICFYDAEGRITGHFGIQRDVTERKRAAAALQQYNKRLKVLQDIDRAILAAHSPEEIASAVIARLQELVPCVRASVAVFDFENNIGKIIALHAKHPTKLGLGAELMLTAFGESTALHTGKVNVVADIENLADIAELALVRGEGVRSYINVPLLAQGELIGALNLGAEQAAAFSSSHIEIAQEAANSLAVAIRQAQLREQIEHHALALETRVQERTATLAEVNASLQDEVAVRQKAELALRDRLAIEQMIGDISTRFINLAGEHLDEGINYALERMGRLVDVDRSYLFLFSDDHLKARNTHEWCGPEATPQIQNLQDLKVADFAWIFPRLLRGETVYIPRVSELPAEAEMERTVLQEQAIQSLLAVPLVYKGRVRGLLGFDAVRAEKVWIEEDMRLLNVVGEIIMQSLQRRQAETRVQERLKIEKLISEISTSFINLPAEEVDNGINYALRRLGEVENVERSYLFLLFDEGARAVNTHEWCAEGVAPQIHNLQNLAFHELPWASRKTMQREILYVPRVADLPEEAWFEKNHWQEQNIQSLLTVPLIWGGMVQGFIGFDSVRAEKLWQEEDVRLLNIVSEVIANTLHRKQVAEALRASEARLQRIFASAMDAIIIIDDTMHAVMCNAAAEKVFRCSSAEVKSKRFDPFLSENFRAILTNYIQSATTQSAPQYLWAPEGLTAQRKDGETFPLEATISRFEISQQNLFTIILRDINERKQAEEEMARLQTQNVYLREEALKSEYNFGEIIGASEAMQKIYASLKMVAATDATVLLLGETGTGKELIARTIHNLSGRKEQVMVKVNCGALPAGLVESELFGHEKGAFTGATAQKKGRFELAHRGTIFLDEVGELPLDTQVKLLRVLQEQEFERVGGAQTLKVNVRVIAATNRNLQEQVQRGAFRADLFYRLNIFPLEIPPLRERSSDIPLLANYFVREFARRLGKRITSINQKALDKLTHYNWPGNVRELANILERAVILCQGRALQEEHIGIFLAAPAMTDSNEKFETLEEAERRHILQALERTNGVLAGPNGAAQLLGMNRSTLWSKMRKLGIETKDAGSGNIAT